MRSPFKTTYLLLGIFAVLLVVVIFFENSSVDKKKIETGESKPIFTESQVTSINKVEFVNPTIEGKDPELITLIRGTDGKWTVNGFVIASDEESRLYEYLRGSGIGKVVSKNEVNWDKYELTDDKAKKAVIYAGDSPISTLYFGSMGTNYQTVYSRRNSDKQVYLVDSDFSDLFNYDVNRWRSKDLFTVKKEDLSAFKVRIGEESWSFVKENDVWSRVRDTETVALEDQQVFLDYLDKLFEQKGMAIEKDQTKFKEADNAVALTLIDGTEHVVLIDKSDEPPQYFARVSSQSDLIVLGSDLQSVLKPNLDNPKTAEEKANTDGAESTETPEKLPEPVFEYSGD